jgi:hypothetical protein
MANDEWILDEVYRRPRPPAIVRPSALVQYRDMVKSDVADIKNRSGRRRDHRGGVPGCLHQRLSLGPPRHRGDGLEREAGADHGSGWDGCRSAHPRRVLDPLEEARGTGTEAGAADIAALRARQQRRGAEAGGGFSHARAARRTEAIAQKARISARRAPARRPLCWTLSGSRSCGSPIATHPQTHVIPCVGFRLKSPPPRTTRDTRNCRI